jgi:hypothetical protein
VQIVGIYYNHIYHDARSYECQMEGVFFKCMCISLQMWYSQKFWNNKRKIQNVLLVVDNQYLAVTYYFHPGFHLNTGKRESLKTFASILPRTRRHAPEEVTYFKTTWVVFEDRNHAVQETHSVSVMKSIHFCLYREVIILLWWKYKAHDGTFYA